MNAMKRWFAILVLFASVNAFGQGITYNISSNVLTVPSVAVGGTIYVNVTLLNVGNYTFTLQQASAQAGAQSALASYSTATSILTLPSVTVGSTVYDITMLNVGNYTFTLQSASISAAVGAGSAGVAEGIWDGPDPSDFGLAAHLLVEPDGHMWGFPNDLLPIAGIGLNPPTVGLVSTSGGTVSGTFRSVAQALFGICVPAVTQFSTTACAISGLANSAQLSISGLQVVTAPGLNSTLPVWTFGATRNTSYATPASVAQLPGLWTANTLFPGNPGAGGTFTIDSAGTITVLNIGGCAFTGTLSPVAGRGYFKFTASTLAGTCSLGISPGQVTGVAFLTSAGRSLHLMWLTENYAQYFWAVAAK